MAKIKIQIKNKLNGSIILEYEKENNTIKDTFAEGVKNGANLSDAYLRDADLSDAYLRGANLSGADLSCTDLSCANLRCADLRGANLSGADLSGVNLSSANLSDADLSDANLRRAYLCGAYLRDADLSSANLRDADLSDTYLCGADLRDADLRDANLRRANLRDADLSDTYLCGADLRCAKSVPYIPFACPSDGAFIGWKKINYKLVKLEIPEDAMRCSATTHKCRCDKAKVLAITDFDDKNPIDEILNTSQQVSLLYKVGEMVYPDSFDEDRWNECSHGIHFFTNKQDAINY